MREFADDIVVNYKLVAQTMSKVSQAITKALEDDFIDKSLFNDNEQVFIDDLKEIVVKRAEAFKDVSTNMSKVIY